MAYTSLRIHPAIGIARVGNSDEYFLGPETAAGAGELSAESKTPVGGLPILPGTEGDTLQSADLRDSAGRLKRQGARFRLFAYEFADGGDGVETWPSNARSREIAIGDEIDGKTVQDILWSVHLANKKALAWESKDLSFFDNHQLPPPRNPDFSDPATRLRSLMIDAGPRAVAASATASVAFDKTTQAATVAHGTIVALPNYPKQFPASDGPQTDYFSNAITTLGGLHCEASGRLVVLGGYGRACGFDSNGNYSANPPLNGNVNNDFWLDDTADGPVCAWVVFADGSVREVEGSAWVIVTDPAYAPQIPNVVSLWDEVNNTWVRHLGLRDSVYRNGAYDPAYVPDFGLEVMPMFRAAALQRWVVNLPSPALTAHYNIGDLSVTAKNLNVVNFLRDPDAADEASQGAPLMPLSLGDSGKSFLSVTPTQYHFVKRWWNADGESKLTLGKGERLDHDVLYNCLGGRFSPGIEMSFPVRDLNLYRRDWQRHDAGGPFRLNRQVFDYAAAQADRPFLSEGYIPLRPHPVEPGDICKFMALPWHTDYNSCATHVPNPNPGVAAGNNPITQDGLRQDWNRAVPSFNVQLYASWPAQRPVAVYPYADAVQTVRDNPRAKEDQILPMRFSVRGKYTSVDLSVTKTTAQNGTWEYTQGATQLGRFQDEHRKEILKQWWQIGTVWQSVAVTHPDTDPTLRSNWFVEVASKFDQDESNLSEYQPNTVIDQTYPPRP